MSKKRKPLPADLSFRPYAAEDFAPLRQLNDVLFPIKYDDEFYQWLVKPGFYSLLVVGPSGEIAAAATARKKRPRSVWSRIIDWWDGIDTDSHAYLMTFGVSPAYRRQGLGETLLERFQQVLAQHGIKDLTLHVKRGNEDALRFYRKHGLEVVKVLHNYYNIEGKLHDALWMRLRNVGEFRKVSIEQSLIGPSDPGNEGNLVLVFLLVIFVVFIAFIGFRMTQNV